MTRGEGASAGAPEPPAAQWVEVPGAPAVREPLRGVLRRLAAGAGILLAGPYRYVDALFRYCQRHADRLVDPSVFAGVRPRARRSAAITRARWRRLHHLLLLARGNRLLEVHDPPETAGLQEWLNSPTGQADFLIPVRRLQRILSDMRRAREGIPIDLLGERLTILPHVYVPADQSVPAMVADYRDLFPGRRVLDMGTGTGVLALLAARFGAAAVVATDNSPNAVRTARINVERLHLAGRIEVRGPADLYDAVGRERFDVIVFNAPWICGTPRTRYEMGTYDPDYCVLDAFLAAAPRHLTRGGVVLLQYSDTSQRTGEGALDHLDRVLGRAGLTIASRRSIARVGRILGARERVFLFEIRPTGSRA
jgi:methylase of polypeptide subunit release factors